MATKTKEKPMEVVKINKVDEERDEVFVYREEPYYNEAWYVPAGTYKLGPLPVEATKEEG